MAWVYIITGDIKEKAMHYIGSTVYDDVNTRIKQHLNHNNGLKAYTAKMTNIKLLWAIELPATHVRCVEYHIKQLNQNGFTAMIDVCITQHIHLHQKLQWRRFSDWLTEHHIGLISIYPSGIL